MKIYTNVTTSKKKMLVRYYDTEKRKSYRKKFDFQSRLFLPTETQTPHKSIYGTSLREIVFETPMENWEFRKRYKEMGQPLYGDIAVPIQFLSGFHSNETVTPLDHVRIFNIDIEVDHGDVFPDPSRADKPINGCTIYDTVDNVMHVFALEYPGASWTQDVRWTDSKYKFDYKGYSDEKDLLKGILDLWCKKYPDVITGWYTKGFDVPYLINRIKRILGEDEVNKLSPWGKITDTSDKQTKRVIYTIVGISHLDYRDLYMKYSGTPRENYKLGTVAYAELKETKLSYDEFSSLPELYRNDFQKFVDYNIKDVDLVQRLDTARGFLALVLATAYYGKVNFDDVSSPIRVWDSLIYNHLKESDIQINPPSRATKIEKYRGGYVKKPQLGKHKWVVSLDLASEYPSVMRGTNISPDTLVDEEPVGISIDDVLEGADVGLEELKEKDLARAANGTRYARAQPGFMNVLLTTLSALRAKNKKLMLDAYKMAESTTGKEKALWVSKAGLFNVQQNAQKVLLNSAYGGLGNEYSRWFDTRLAVAITSSGELAVRWVEKAVNKYMNNVLGTTDVDYIIYIDTDSIYVRCDDVVKKFIPEKRRDDVTFVTDKLDQFFAQKVAGVVTAAYDELFVKMNHREQLMFMKREAIAPVFVLCGKKHYFMRVSDSEGVRYQTPKIKITGMGFIKSDVPEFCRTQCREVMVPLALDGDNASFVEAIDAFEEEFNARPLEEIAKNIGVSGIGRYRGDGGEILKGTPIGPRASITYNNLRAKHKLGSSYPEIKDGDKIKYLYLVKGNPLGVKSIGFLDFLPPPFKLDKLVDRKLMFEKSFIGPVTEILEGLNWKRRIVASLF